MCLSFSRTVYLEYSEVLSTLAFARLYHITFSYSSRTDKILFNPESLNNATYVLDIDLAFVHELDEAFDIGELGVLHDDNGILVAGAVGQDGVEVGAAGAKHHPMRPDGFTLAGKRHVAEASAVQQL